MKRAVPWSDKSDDDDDDSSSSSDSESDSNKTKPQGKSGTGRRKTGAIDFETLKRHGYKGGLSVMSVPPPKDDTEPDWSWSNGKESRQSSEAEESYQERQKTRAAIQEAELLTNVQTRKEREKKNATFSQKEKRKRDLGQASRGKNYVEEEKRQLRDSGIYSGFDS